MLSPKFKLPNILYKTPNNPAAVLRQYIEAHKRMQFPHDTVEMLDHIISSETMLRELHCLGDKVLKKEVKEIHSYPNSHMVAQSILLLLPQFVVWQEKKQLSISTFAY